MTTASNGMPDSVLHHLTEALGGATPVLTSTIEDRLADGSLVRRYTAHAEGVPNTTVAVALSASGELLDRGPLVLALFRGGWCPYCDLTMVALEQARAAIEALGARAVGIIPEGPEQIAATGQQRGIGYLLLSDPANLYARTCGLAYELSPNHIRIHRERGRNFPTLHSDTTWRLPVPAVFVARPDARIAFAFADVDPARWPDPEELIASLDALSDAHALSKR